MTQKKLWLLSPQDTLLFGDGRPSGFGDAMQTLPLPLPSTLAGFVRTKLGTSSAGKFEWSYERALAQQVYGPWLCELDALGSSPAEQLFPAPLDSVLFEADDPATARQWRLQPMQRPAPGRTDLSDDYQLVGFPHAEGRNPGKPVRSPSLWSWSRLRAWLESSSHAEVVTLSELGLDALPQELRTHVGINPEAQTAADGALFQTQQLRFQRRVDGVTRSFAILFGTPEQVDAERLSGHGMLGGERRIAHVSALADQWPQAPQWTPHDNRVRMILLTPAIFRQGWRPDDETLGQGAKLIAAKVGRPVPVSGWSFKDRGPKPTRYMAPAGSVYWIELAQGVDVQRWVEQRQFSAICDDPQDNLDGFGLIAIGRG